MSEQYAHTLIARQKDFTPSPLQIEKFLSAMISKKVVPAIPEIVLGKPTGKFREYPYKNPFTGENIKFEIKDIKKFNDLAEATKELESVTDYELEIAASGQPALAPLPIKMDEPYYVSIICFVSSIYRSTSDSHDETASGDKVAPYRTPCSTLPELGLFNNPHTMEVLKVPDAGYARFWLQFELGKFLFPEIKNDNLEILNSQIVSEAENAFGIQFVQGCYWG